MTTSIGFVGLGIMGVGMVKNLIGKIGCNLVVWNRGVAISEEIKLKYPGRITIASTPADVVKSCQTTFCMLSTLEASQAVFDTPNGIIDGISPGKVIVDCATLSPERMIEENSRITSKGGRFLEAPVSGSKVPAETGQLIFLCGGEEALYNDKDIQAALDAMGKAKFYFGPAGQGSRVKLVVNMMMGTIMTTLSEGLALSKAADLPQETILQVLQLSAIATPLFNVKGPNIINSQFPAHFPLKHQQKDMRLALELAEQVGVSLPVSAAANREYEKVLPSRGEEDFSAVSTSIEFDTTKQNN